MNNKIIFILSIYTFIFFYFITTPAHAVLCIPIGEYPCPDEYVYDDDGSGSCSCLKRGKEKKSSRGRDIDFAASNAKLVEIIAKWHQTYPGYTCSGGRSSDSNGVHMDFSFCRNSSGYQAYGRNEVKILMPCEPGEIESPTSCEKITCEEGEEIKDESGTITGCQIKKDQQSCPVGQESTGYDANENIICKPTNKKPDMCPEGEVNLNGKCLKVGNCPPGQMSVDGVCKSNPDKPTDCASVETNINGICVKTGTCPPGQMSVDGVCKPNPDKPTDCAPGETNINGICFKTGTCPPGQFSVDGVCQSNSQGSNHGDKGDGGKGDGGKGDGGKSDGDKGDSDKGYVDKGGGDKGDGDKGDGDESKDESKDDKPKDDKEEKPKPGPATDFGSVPEIPDSKSWYESKYEDGLDGIWSNFSNSISVLSHLIIFQTISQEKPGA